MRAMAADGINLTNQFLIAMPGMADERFAGSVVYLCEHNDQGALGLVVNKPVDINLGELFDKIDLTLGDPTWPSSRCISAARCRPSAASCCTTPVRPTRPTYSSTLTVPEGLEMTTSKDVLEAIAAAPAPSACWSRWATAAGARASWRTSWAATAG
jgi:putative transcriptional regulator